MKVLSSVALHKSKLSYNDSKKRRKFNIIECLKKFIYTKEQIGCKEWSRNLIQKPWDPVST